MGWGFPHQAGNSYCGSQESIFLRFGVPNWIREWSCQGLVEILGTNWKLHCVYHPQSLGQVDRMHRTLKETLNKLSLETGGALPLALFQALNNPYHFNLTYFKILFGTPTPLVSTGPSQEVYQLIDRNLFLRLQPLSQYNMRFGSNCWP